MNGKTTINSTLNPGSAEMDRNTYGWKNFNVSIHGKRLIRLHVLRLTVDVYSGTRKPLTAMGGGANDSARYWQLFWPLGQVMFITKKANENCDSEERS